MCFNQNCVLQSNMIRLQIEKLKYHPLRFKDFSFWLTNAIYLLLCSSVLAYVNICSLSANIAEEKLRKKQVLRQVNLNVKLGNYDRLTDRPTQQTGSQGNFTSNKNTWEERQTLSALDFITERQTKLSVDVASRLHNMMKM